MTETTCVATNFPWPELDETGSIGRPLPNLDVKYVQDCILPIFYPMAWCSKLSMKAKLCMSPVARPWSVDVCVC